MPRCLSPEKENTNVSYRTAFWDEQSGSATIMVVVLFVMMIALSGLVVDVGRVMNIHSQASSYVDRVALAAAAELDGETTSMNRAVRAAVGDGEGPIIQPGFRISLTGDNDIGISRMVFMASITDDPADPFARSPLPGDDVLCEWTPGGGIDCSGSGLSQAQASAQATFVMVEATTEVENFIVFPIAATLSPGIATQASVAPQAVAGFTSVICNIPPLAICNPFENPGGGGSFTPIIGQQIQLVPGNQGEQWAPGNFGFLQVPPDAGGALCSGGENSAARQRCVFSLRDPNTRCVSTRVSTSPGRRESIQNGINTRFDIYEPPLSRTDPNTPPAANVTKGIQFTGNNCRVSGPSVSDSGLNPLPRDPCFTDGTCTAGVGDSRFGDGITQEALRDYWAVNHNGAPLPPQLVVPGVRRFDVYRFVIDNGMIPSEVAGTGGGGTGNGNGNGGGGNGEDGSPTCSTAVPDNSSNPDRRVLISAVINCEENGVAGNTPNVPVESFLEIFLTEPAGLAGVEIVDPEDGSIVLLDDIQGGDLVGEVIDVVEPGTNGPLRVFPVLYR